MNMNMVPPFAPGALESLARLLGDCGSGSEITRVLASCGIEDNSGESTKWKRLNWVFAETQRQYKCSNKVITFIQSHLAPVRFVGRKDEFERHRTELNAILAFSGLEFGPDGQIRRSHAVKTITEAERRANTIQAKFQGRRIHPEVLTYCRAELMQDNYFHAVFEATKGLAQRVREMSGVDADGAALVDRVFSIGKPMLAFNSLRTETERSEHTGFATLLKGCFAAIRNPRAHEPRILWKDEDDAADYFTLISHPPSEARRLCTDGLEEASIKSTSHSYPTYKPSGVPRLGDVPAHWQVRRLGSVAAAVNGATPSTNVPEYWGGDIMWITPDDLGKLRNRYVADSARRITEEGYKSCGTTMAPANSLAVSTRAPIGHLGILQSESCVNQGCRLLIPGPSIQTEYLHYSLSTSPLCSHVLRTGKHFYRVVSYAIAWLPYAPPLPSRASLHCALSGPRGPADSAVYQREA